MKNCKEISKLVAVKYNHYEPKMSVSIKKIDNPMIAIPEILKDTSSRVEIFILDHKYKEAKKK